MARTRQVKQEGRSRGTVTSVRSSASKWLVRVYTGTKMVDGEPVRQYASKVVAGTYKQADAERVKMLADIDAKTFVPPTNQTVQAFVSSWLDTTAKARVSVRTQAAYRQMMETHVLPTIGHRKLDALTSQEIQKVYDAITTGGGGPRLVRYVHVVLKMALKQAVEWQLIRRNPAEYVTLPKYEKTDFTVLTAAQVSLLLEQTAAIEHGVLWNFLLNSGLRPQEAFALTWDDIADGKVSVSKALKADGKGGWYVGPTKTKAGRRTLALPQATLKALEVHKRAQAAAILKAGPAYQRLNLVFPSSRGTHLDIANVRKWWEKSLLKLHLPLIRLYDCRHTHATLLLLAAVNVKAVSARLGHSTVVITLDTYAKWMPEMDTSAASAIEDLILKAAGDR